MDEVVSNTLAFCGFRESSESKRCKKREDTLVIFCKANALHPQNER